MCSEALFREAAALRLRRVGRAARGEVHDSLHVVMLGLRSELADRHVFDHAQTQRPDSLRGHGVLLSWVRVSKPLDLKDASPRYVVGHAAAEAPYRASGLVL
jgi:hypothetical protein